MKVVKGNLLTMFSEGDFDVIIHGCNCHHSMGGGIAAQIARVHPGAARVDILQTKHGDESKLGNYTFFHPSRNRTIINAYTQHHPGPDANLLNIRDVFERICDSPLIEGRRVGIPMLGAGIGGLVWDDVHRTIEDTGIDQVCKIVVVEFDPSR